MFRSPCCGPVLGKGSKVPPGSIGRSCSASPRSCGEPAGRGPTASWRRIRAIARAESKRFPPSELEPPHAARARVASSSSAASAALRRYAGLRGLLALALDARLRGDARHRGLLMAAGTIPDHIRLRHALLACLRLHLAPGKLGLGEIIPAGQVQRLERALQCRPPVLFGAEHRPDHLKLLVTEPDDPHKASSDLGCGQLRAVNGRKPKPPASRALRRSGVDPNRFDAVLADRLDPDLVAVRGDQVAPFGQPAELPEDVAADRV